MGSRRRTRKGVVHRDLKPENVFLTSDGRGQDSRLRSRAAAARVTEGATDGPTVARTRSGVVLGTFGYMSPEQVLGERVDGRSDIFAAGCVIYEMLTGRRLFNGATPQEIVASLMHDRLPVLVASIRSRRRSFAPIVSRCVDRDRGGRFAVRPGPCDGAARC